MKYEKIKKVKYAEENDVKNYEMIIKIFERLFLTFRSAIDSFLCGFNSVFDGASFQKRINMLTVFEVEICVEYEKNVKIFVIGNIAKSRTIAILSLF